MPAAPRSRYWGLLIVVLLVAACGDATADRGALSPDDVAALDPGDTTTEDDASLDPPPTDARSDANAAPNDNGALADSETGTLEDAQDDAADTGLDPSDADDTDDADDATADARPDGDAPSDADLTDDTDTPPDDATPLFDLEAIARVDDLDCRFEGSERVVRRGVTLDTWSVSFLSWEWRDGGLQPIRLRGYAARPVGSDPRPSVVLMHGLGGAAQRESTAGVAALTGAFVIAPTGPGGGTTPTNTSEGLPAGHADGYRMFDVLENPRGSWFWGHATGAMRALTCLHTRPGARTDATGITGYSAGGVVSWIVAGVDPRVHAAVPLSGTGRWPVATESANAWQHALLQQAGLSIASPEWIRLNETIDAADLVAGTSARVWIVNGTTDEFFPLSAHSATWQMLPPSTQHRQSLAANYDHGCFGLTGGEPQDRIQNRAIVRAEGAQRAWFHHVFGTDARYRTLPISPTLRLDPAAPGVRAAVAEVDTAGGAFNVSDVSLWFSTDDAVLFQRIELTSQGGGLWGALVPEPAANVVYYVDVEYRTREVIGAQSFSLSSDPYLPSGHVPRIRSMTSCLP